MRGFSLMMLLLLFAISFAAGDVCATETKTHTASATGSETASGAEPGAETADKEETPEEKEAREAKELAGELVSADLFKSGRTAEDLNEEAENMDKFMSELKNEDGTVNETVADAFKEVLEPLQRDLQAQLDALPANSPQRAELSARLGRIAALQTFISNAGNNPVAVAGGPGANSGTGGSGSNNGGTGSGSSGNKPGDLDNAGQFGGTSDPKTSGASATASSGTGSSSQPSPAPAPMKTLPIPTSPSTIAAAEAPVTKPAPTPAPQKAPPTIYQSSLAAVNKATSAITETFFKPTETKTETASAAAVKKTEGKEGVVSLRETPTARPTAIAKTVTPPALPTQPQSTSVASASSPASPASSTAVGENSSFDFSAINPPVQTQVASAGTRPFATEVPRGVTTIEDDFFAKPETPASLSLAKDSAPAVEPPSSREVVTVREVAATRNAFDEFSRELKRGFNKLKETLSTAPEAEEEENLGRTEVPERQEQPEPRSASSEPDAQTLAVKEPPAPAKPGGTVLQFMNLMKQKALENPV